MRFIVLVLDLIFMLGGPALAAAEPGFAWKETRTVHCVFLYQEKDSAAARELVGFAEEAYAAVTAYLDSYPREVRSVVIGDIDVANGAYGAPPHHLELYVRAPISPWLSAQMENWLKLLFIHELAHFCDLDAEYGFFYTLSLILGEGVKSGDVAFQPAWMYEGLAVLLETELTRGGRGRNPFFLMYAKALLLEDAPLTLGHLEYASAYPPPDRFYLFGYLMLDHLKRNYGADVFRRIRRRFLDCPLLGPWEAISFVTGKHQDELWDEMRRERKARFLEEAVGGEGSPVSPDLVADYSHPIPTRAGLYCYRKRLDRAQSIVVLDPAAGTETVILQAGLTDEQSFTASADGRTIVYAEIFSSGIGLSRYRAESDLFIARIGGAEDKKPFVKSQKRLTARQHLWHPALSPDGSRLAAVQGAGSYSRLVLVDQGTGEVSVLFAEESTDVFNAAFSPDGKLIAFVLNRRGQPDIHLMNADASTVPAGSAGANVNIGLARPLLGRDFAGDYYPRFLDDRTVLFTSDREGGLALYRAEIGGRELKRVFRERIAAFDGVLEDGLLYYATYRSRGYRLMAFPAAGLSAEIMPLAADEEPLPPFPRPEIEARPYVDLPGFLYWRPHFGFQFAQGAYHFALGFAMAFGSTMDTNAIDLGLVYYPSFNQPEFELQYRTQAGSLDVFYTVRHGYTELGDSPSFVYQERWSQSADLVIPLFDSLAVSGADTLNLSFGVQHHYLLQSASSFAFLNGLSPAALPQWNLLVASAGLFFSHSLSGGPADFYPAWTVANHFQAMGRLPLLDETNPGVILADRFYFTLPGLWNLSVLRIGLKAAYDFRATLGQPAVNPRGNFRSAPQTEPGRGILLVDYLFTIAYLDAPLAGGFHFDKLGAGLHWEAPFDWDAASPAFALDRYFYVGAELNFQIGLGRLTLPVGIGFNLRLDWSLAEIPDLSDFGLYFFLNISSFWIGGRDERPPLGLRPGL